VALEGVERKLAAILAADVAGYSRMAGTDEERTLARLAATMESSMSKAGLDNRHRNHDGEISHKHGNTLIRALRIR
jgi:class 3 adenylate cyclase